MGLEKNQKLDKWGVKGVKFIKDLRTLILSTCKHNETNSRFEYLDFGWLMT